jgi:hypothetical protein
MRKSMRSQKKKKKAKKGKREKKKKNISFTDTFIHGSSGHT